MKKIKRAAFGTWNVLKQAPDDCGIFPISARVSVYGLILTTLLYSRSSIFDAGELVTIVTFCSTITFIELAWKKYDFGKTLFWHLGALISLLIFLFVLLNQAINVRESWYRTHVLENRISTLIGKAPTAIIVADGLGNIKSANGHVLELVGWSEEELKGQPLSILMRPHKYIEHKKAYDKVADDLKNGSVSWVNVGDRIFRMVSKSGQLIKVQIYIFSIKYSSDIEYGFEKGKDIEFYAIIQPLKPLIDLEVEEALEVEDIKDKLEEKNAIKNGLTPKIPQ